MCHAHRARHLAHRPSLADTFSPGHLAVLGFIHSVLVCFHHSFFILDLSLLSFSSPSRSPCHRTSTTAAPFNLALRCRALTHNTLPVFNLNTGRSSHTTLCALSPAGTLWTSPLPFPSLSLCSVHCITADSDSYKYPVLASPKGRQIGPHFPFVFVCFQATVAPSVSSHLCSCSLVPRPTRSRLLPLATVACEPVRSAQLTISSPSRLDRRPVTHTCGSGNNKLHTPLPVTLARVPFSGTSRGFIFILRTSELSRGLTLRYTEA